MEKMEFGNVIWTEEDVRQYLDEHPEYPGDEDFACEVINRCVNDHHFTEPMIEAGWETIAWHAWNALREWREAGHG